MSTANQTSGAIPLAERLSLLFRVWHRRDADETTSEAVAAAVSGAGVPITAAQIGELRDGTRTAESADALAAIAEFFNTPARYLTELDPRDLHEQLLLLEKFRDAKVNSIHLRGARTDADRRALLEVLGSEDDGEPNGVDDDNDNDTSQDTDKSA